MKPDDMPRSLRTRPALYWLVCLVTVAASGFAFFFITAILTAAFTSERQRNGLLKTKSETAVYVVATCSGLVGAGLAFWLLRRRYTGRRFLQHHTHRSRITRPFDRSDTRVKTDPRHDPGPDHRVTDLRG